MKVKCPKCHRVDTYRATDQYNPDVAPHGGMVELVEPEKRNGLTFDNAKGPVRAALMECCDCGGQLVRGGKLLVVEEHVCRFCGKICKANYALASHMRVHKKEIEDEERKMDAI